MMLFLLENTPMDLRGVQDAVPVGEHPAWISEGNRTLFLLENTTHGSERGI
jgi:hypothetical protein